MFKNSFEVTQEVTIEVTINEVMESIDHDELFNALLEQGCDLSDAISNMECSEVLDNFQHYEIVSWAVSNLDTYEVLDALKDTDEEGFTGWLEKNDDILPTKVKAEEEKKEEPKPEPIPLVRPVVSMNEGRILVAGRADSLESLSVFDAGTYKVFGGVIAVTALGVEFMTTSVQSAEVILSSIAFAQANVNKEV